MRNSAPNISGRALRILGILVVAVVGYLVLLSIAQQHFYVFRRIEPGQIGVMIRGGQISRIVPPGTYSDVGLFVSLKNYSIEAYQFSVSDTELITSDNQRIGVTVSGSFFRPDFTKQDRIANLWARYQHIYVND